MSSQEVLEAFAAHTDKWLAGIFCNQSTMIADNGLYIFAEIGELAHGLHSRLHIESDGLTGAFEDAVLRGQGVSGYQDR